MSDELWEAPLLGFSEDAGVHFFFQPQAIVVSLEPALDQFTLLETI